MSDEHNGPAFLGGSDEHIQKPSIGFASFNLLG
jgi:hypothetical protein